MTRDEIVAAVAKRLGDVPGTLAVGELGAVVDAVLAVVEYGKAPEPQPEPDVLEVACWLAEASDSPRYGGEEGGALLVNDPSNIEHAYRKAIERATADEHAKLRGWRDFLLRDARSRT